MGKPNLRRFPPLIVVVDNYIRQNLQRVRKNISAACARAGRAVNDVTLVAVTKLRAPEEIKGVLDCGVHNIGENRVQEALSKYRQLGDSSGLVWHLIGHLQRNKVRDALEIFDLIHSVDSLRLAEEIDKQAGKIGKIQDVLLQVNIAREEAKYGIKEEDLPELIRAVDKLDNLRLKGLMLIAPLVDSPEKARVYFRRLKGLFGECHFDKGAALSMGMSRDYEVAIEEGATMVRIGRDIFSSPYSLLQIMIC